MITTTLLRKHANDLFTTMNLEGAYDIAKENILKDLTLIVKLIENGKCQLQLFKCISKNRKTIDVSLLLTLCDESVTLENNIRKIVTSSYDASVKSLYEHDVNSGIKLKDAYKIEKKLKNDYEKILNRHLRKLKTVETQMKKHKLPYNWDIKSFENPWWGSLAWKIHKFLNTK